MLKIINVLEPFFEDCYRRISVREYARLMRVSPPTASKMLDSYHKKGLLVKSSFKNYLLFYANKENREFIALSRIYWNSKLGEVISFMVKRLAGPTIVLFGSLSKAEVKPDSDVDLAVFSLKKKLDIEVFERKLKRKIQIFWFDSIKDIKNKGLATNIINGHVLEGRLRI
jgi:predicted nucleotidyltransferase